MACLSSLEVFLEFTRPSLKILLLNNPFSDLSQLSCGLTRFLPRTPVQSVSPRLQRRPFLVVLVSQARKGRRAPHASLVRKMQHTYGCPRLTSRPGLHFFNPVPVMVCAICRDLKLRLTLNCIRNWSNSSPLYKRRRIRWKERVHSLSHAVKVRYYPQLDEFVKDAAHGICL